MRAIMRTARHLTIGALLALCLLAPGPGGSAASAATCHVDPAQGDDGADGLAARAGGGHGPWRAASSETYGN